MEVVAPPKRRGKQSPNIHTRQAVILWLQETYGVVPNSGLSTPKEDVYKDYAQMCARDGKSAMARATFGKILHVPLSDDDESNSSDGQRQTDSPDYPSAGHHSGGGGGSALDSYPGYSLGSSMSLSRPAALSSQSPGSSSSLSPSFASPSMAGGGSAATIGASPSPPPSPIHLSTSLPPLPVYHPPFNPYPSAMHGGYPGSFAPSSSASAYLMAASPSAAPSSSLFHPISSPLQHRRAPSPPPHSYPSPYHQHLGSGYLRPTTALQEPARAPAPSGWSSHVDSLLYDTSGGSGVTGARDCGSAEQLSHYPNNSHHQQLQQPNHLSPTSTSPAGNLPCHYQSLTPSLASGPSPSSSGPTSSSSFFSSLRPSPESLPPFPPPHHLHRHGAP
ncbi:uncharacterized protein ACA1_287840 [Acanthamoeba castellanii str. Neff]|uniref:RFX-type winged-helix domain-containing protein n=1 Tax=Acanthamoeba castellanii (strain ATCC 30010 / Neff) TaxID=1257118 RepID=L8HKA9_ACACF|nr:uncharacterized protein ACA1_287840 [Acanthamoeba castellanii str. Neff]ELR25083.1 hypothetical protein ACA1_287840 [Acanthamoeba castellanii str. Neff]